jgi:hypothetical protein
MQSQSQITSGDSSGARVLERSSSPYFFTWSLVGRSHLVFIGIMTLISFLINGYRYGIWDHAFTIPLIEQTADPALFSKDYLFDEEVQLFLKKSNIAIPILAAIKSIVPLEVVFFVLFTVAQYAMFFAIYSISLSLFESHGAAVLAVLLLMFPKPVGGTWTFTQDMYFTLRSFAMPLALWFLLPYFSGRLALAATAAGVVFLVHPITAIPIVCLLGVRCLIDGIRRGWGDSVKAGALLMCFVLPQVVHTVLQRTSAGSCRLCVADQEWVDIIKARDPYLFLSSWSKTEMLAVLFYLFLLVGGIIYRHYQNNTSRLQTAIGKEKDLWSIAVIGLCLAFTVMVWVFVDVFPVPAVMQLQLMRSSNVIIHLGLIYGGWLLWEGIQKARTIPTSRSVRAYLKWGVGPVLLGLTGCLLADNTLNKLIVGSVVLVSWSFRERYQSKIARSDLYRVFVAVVSIVTYLSMMWLLRKVLFQYGIIDSILPPLYMVALVAFLILELLRRWASRRAWTMPKMAVAGAVFFATTFGLITANGDVFRRAATLEHFGEEVQLPGAPLKSNWTVGKNYSLNDLIDLGQWAKAHCFLSPQMFLNSGSILCELSWAHGMTVLQHSIQNDSQRSGEIE